MRRKQLLKAAITALLCLSVSACGVKVPQENIGNFEFDAGNYPRMGGSIAALPFGEAVTAAVLGIDRRETEEYITFDGSTTSNYTSLVDGRFDILIAYEPSEEAMEYARERGFEWEIRPVGRDALVFIVNIDNTVVSLTDGQIRGIYSGEITNWSEVGGKNAEIIPYQRNKESGSQTLFDKLLNMGGDLMEPPGKLVLETMIGLLEVVADYENSGGAMGYTVYYYLTNMEKEKLENTRILAIGGVECNNDTIRSGKYPYVNDFYVVIPANLPEDAPAKVLADWICSEQGKDLAERENYVAL